MRNELKTPSRWLLSKPAQAQRTPQINYCGFAQYLQTDFNTAINKYWANKPGIGLDHDCMVAIFFAYFQFIRVYIIPNKCYISSRIHYCMHMQRKIVGLYGFWEQCS